MARKTLFEYKKNTKFLLGGHKMLLYCKNAPVQINGKVGGGVTTKLYHIIQKHLYYLFALL